MKTIPYIIYGQILGCCRATVRVIQRGFE